MNKKVVILGGGTGLSSLLRGLKQYPLDITAVVRITSYNVCYTKLLRSERHARSLLKLSNMSEQRQMLNKIVENRLTVRKTDEEISQLLRSINSVDTEEGSSENVLVPNYNIEDEQTENPFKILPIVSDKVPTFDSTNVIEKDSFMEEPIIIIDA